jgi:hypothetical protein
MRPTCPYCKQNSELIGVKGAERMQKCAGCAPACEICPCNCVAAHLAGHHLQAGRRREQAQVQADRHGGLLLA